MKSGATNFNAHIHSVLAADFIDCKQFVKIYIGYN